MDINVLLVEDNESDYRLTKEMVNDLNLQSKSTVFLSRVGSFSELEYFFSKNENIDLVLLDLGLPESQGIETFINFKNKYNQFPIVVYTGIDNIFIGTELLENGADDYLSKNDSSTSILFKTIIINIERYKLKKKLKDNESMLIEQSRSAAMGDMISIIAHQWKQPLAVLSMIANNIKADVQLDECTKESLIEYSENLNEQIQHLSNTVNDFINYFKTNKTKEKCTLTNIINGTVKLIEKSLKAHDIKYFICITEDIELEIIPNELSHALINIINNAEDSLIQNNISNKQISIEVKKIDDIALIQISDNAGGIKDDIIDKIFDPYFTTKGKLNGTGLGLYISKTIIQEHFKGKIEFENISDGAQFTIKIPLNT